MTKKNKLKSTLKKLKKYKRIFSYNKKTIKAQFQTVLTMQRKNTELQNDLERLQELLDNTQSESQTESHKQAVNCIQTIANATDTVFDNEEFCVQIIENTINKLIESNIEF